MPNFKFITALLLVSALSTHHAFAEDVLPTPEPASTLVPMYTYAPGSTGGGIHVSPTGYMTVTGVVIGKPSGKLFLLRNRRGRLIIVDFRQPQVPTDGTLTIYGQWDGNVLKTTNFYYDDGLYGSRAYSESKRQIPTYKGTLTGTLVNDAEPDGFDLRDSKGVIHSILTRRFLTFQGTRALKKGMRVRVSGDRSIRDGVSELDAGFLVNLSRGK